MYWILIRFELNYLWSVRGCKYIGYKLCTLLNWFVKTRFTPAFIFVLFRTLSPFIILVFWWVSWIWRRRIWQTWFWIRFSWYVWYRTGWIVVWIRISFRCQDFCWWVMQWWRRFNSSPISKYWWSGYRSRCMYQMYRRCKYIFYCVNIGWIMDWSDFCRIVWNGLIWIGVIRFNMNWFEMFLILI